MTDDRCPVCANVGWYLDYAGGAKGGPLMLELLPCIYPPCESSGRRVEHLGMQHLAFSRPVIGPSGFVMAVGR